MNELTLMGILNVTPDSFYDGGEYNSVEKAADRAREMIEHGADIIDIGGESTRPGADKVSAEKELKRVLPVVKALKDYQSVKLSVDTRKPLVAEEVLKYDIDMLNVVSGFENPELIELASKADVYTVIMHMQENPKTMQDNPTYDNVVEDVRKYLSNQAERLVESGISEDRIVVDPGIGFGKTLEHNKLLIQNISDIQNLGYKVMVGHSRKSFLGEVLNKKTDGRLTGTLSVSQFLFEQSVDILRVHDVREHAEMRRVFKWLKPGFKSNNG